MDNVNKDKQVTSVDKVNPLQSRINENTFKDEDTSPPIDETVAQLWNRILKTGLPKNSIKEIMGKYPPPKNCTFMNSPNLNPEVKRILKPKSLKKDEFRVADQNQLSTTINSVGLAITEMLKGDNSSHQA